MRHRECVHGMPGPRSIVVARCCSVVIDCDQCTRRMGKRHFNVPAAVYRLAELPLNGDVLAFACMWTT